MGKNDESRYIVTQEMIREAIIVNYGQVTFLYKGKKSGIDIHSPDWTPIIDLWYGQEMITLSDIDEIMNYPIFDGKNIKEILDEIEDVEF